MSLSSHLMDALLLMLLEQLAGCPILRSQNLARSTQNFKGSTISLVVSPLQTLPLDLMNTFPTSSGVEKP